MEKKSQIQENFMDFKKVQKTSKKKIQYEKNSRICEKFTNLIKTENGKENKKKTEN